MHFTPILSQYNQIDMNQRKLPLQAASGTALPEIHEHQKELNSDYAYRWEHSWCTGLWKQWFQTPFRLCIAKKRTEFREIPFRLCIAQGFFPSKFQPSYNTGKQNYVPTIHLYNMHWDLRVYGLHVFLQDFVLWTCSGAVLLLPTNLGGYWN